MAKAEFPSNSNSGDSRVAHIAKLKAEPSVEGEKTEQPAEKKAEFDGKVFVKKRGIGSKMKSLFVAEGQNLADKVVEEIVKPKIQEMALTIVSQVGQGIYGVIYTMMNPNGGPPTTPSTGGPISYDRISRSAVTAPRTSIVVGRPQVRQSNRLSEIEFELWSDAQKALTYIQSMIEELGHCTLGDYYDYVGIDPESTDQSWGWTDVRRAQIREYGPGRFHLMLPELKTIHRR